MNKKIAILDEYLEILMSDYFNDGVDVVLYDDILSVEADFLLLNNYSKQIPAQIFDKTTILNLHPSLLPAFANDDAIVQGFISGVKVSGVTVHYVEKDNFYGKIIAQYPVIIGNAMHYNEYVDALTSLGNKLYPQVVEALLNDKVFDFSDLIQTRCHNSCGNCGNCH